MITTTVKAHRESLLNIIKDSGQFDDESLAHVTGTLDDYLQNPEEAIWLTALDDEPVGVAYCIPEPVTSGTWNLLMLWMDQGSKGRGFGRALVAELENQLQARQARLLIVETSHLPEFAAARNFYEKNGFQLEAEVKNFFEDGDNKLIYTKPLQQS